MKLVCEKVYIKWRKHYSLCLLLFDFPPWEWSEEIAEALDFPPWEWSEEIAEAFDFPPCEWSEEITEATELKPPANSRLDLFSPGLLFVFDRSENSDNELFSLLLLDADVREKFPGVAAIEFRSAFFASVVLIFSSSLGSW